MQHTWTRAAAIVVDDLTRIFGARLRSVVAYGQHLDGDTTAPLSCLALVDSLSVDDLETCARASGGWAAAGLAVPLLLPADEFRRSLDIFPLEYGEIIRRHEALVGTDPFAGATVEPSDVRRACEAQIASHLLHVRESFIATGGHPTRIAELVVESAPAFTAVLRNLARLAGVTAGNRVDTTLQGAKAAGVDERLAHALLSLERTATTSGTDAARVFPEYFAAIEHVAATVDAWPT